MLDLEKPMRMSASRMKTWMSCPLQAKFKYVDGLPQPENSSGLFGKAVHSALEAYNKSDDVERAIATFERQWEDATPKIEEWTRGTTFGGLRERGIKMVTGYHDLARWEDRTVVATEHKFLVPFGPYELFGFVDLVELRRNNAGEQEIHVVDYKTNKKKPYVNNLHLDVQFTVYVFAAMQPEFWLGGGEYPALCDEELWRDNLSHLRVRPLWYHLETNQNIDAGLRDDADFMRLYRCCDEIHRASEANVYVPNISGDSCGFCPYKKPCGLPLPVRDDVGAV